MARPSTKGGDDLDDDLLLDEDILASSDIDNSPLSGSDDDANVEPHLIRGEDGDGNALDDGDVFHGFEELEDGDDGLVPPSRKRKASPSTDELKPKKKKKRAKPAASTRDGDDDNSLVSSPAKWMRHMQATDGASRKLSGVEVEEGWLPDACFDNTSSFSDERTLDALPEFIRSVPKLAARIAQRSKQPGAPTCIVICAAALRVAEVCRVLKAANLRGEKGGEIAKLFAKHIKLAQHVSYLGSTRISIAVATPGRLQALLAVPDALPLTALTHIILDASHADAKQRRLADIPEVRAEVCALFRGTLGDKIREGGVRVIAY